MDDIRNLESLIEGFEKHSHYLNNKLERDIEENRKGQFVLKLKNKDGKSVNNAVVKVRQVSSEFKFGANLFYLDQYKDEERRRKYRELFKNLFNYAVVPLYWDTLEPVEGKPRFSEETSEPIDRRPPLDTIVKFCRENNIRMKGHCLVYNSFQPEWISDNNRELKMQIERRIKAIAERYPNDFEDMDIINEMIFIYKNCYKGNGQRNMQITDERDYEKWCFETAKKYFPYTVKYWNEGMVASLGGQYFGTRSFYYMMMEKLLRENVEVQGIGFQYHLFENFDELKKSCNPLRIIDAFDCYAEFGLPIHISEISIPSYTASEYECELQAELVKRLYTLWFGRKQCEGIVWWNMADKTAYSEEIYYSAGIVDGECNEKKAYKELDKLINSRWKTCFEAKVSDEVRFSGFYGDYEVTVCADGKKITQNVSLKKDNTGFNNLTGDFRYKDIFI